MNLFDKSWTIWFIPVNELHFLSFWHLASRRSINCTLDIHTCSNSLTILISQCFSHRKHILNLSWNWSTKLCSHSTHNMQINDRSLFWPDTGTSMKSGGDTLVLCVQTSLVKWCCSHVSKMPSIKYTKANSVIIKNAIILNTMHIYLIFVTQYNVIYI